MKIHLLILITTLLLNGCFSPSYGVGGFTCQKGECPEGYACACIQGKDLCQKGDKPNPCVHKKDQGLDLPRDILPSDIKQKPLEQGLLPNNFPCSKPETVAMDIMLGHDTFDLVLDETDTVHVVYVSTKGQILSKSRKSSATPWASLGKQILGAKGDRVAAAINSHRHLMAIFPGGQGTSSAKNLDFSYMDLNSGTQTWDVPKSTNSNIGVTSVDLAGRQAMGSIFYLAITGEQAGSKYPFMAGFLKPRSTGNGYDFEKVCDNAGTAIYNAARVAIGKWGSKPHAVTSVHNRYDKKWELVLYEYEKIGCPATSRFTGNTAVSPVVLGLDNQSGVQMAWGLGKTGLGGLGPGFHMVWSGTGNITPPAPFIQQDMVDPRSVDLALKKDDTPCISAWEYNNVPKEMELRVACKQGPNAWVRSTIIDTHDKPDSKYPGYATRMAVDTKGVLHLAYIHHRQLPSMILQLKHVTCP